MSRIRTELQKLDAAIRRLEQAMETADQRRRAGSREAGGNMDLTVERVDQAIHRLEAVLQD